MENKDFLGQLAMVTAVSIIALTLCNYLLPISEYSGLGIIGIVFFVLISVLVFYLARRAARSENLNAFTHLIMYNLLVKLFFSILILVIYYQVVKPTERLFIIPFVIIYIIFTIFEAMFLSRQARK